MKILIAFVLILAPTLAHACDSHRSSRSKVTNCSSYTYITGTTKTTCRSR